MAERSIERTRSEWPDGFGREWPDLFGRWLSDRPGWRLRRLWDEEEAPMRVEELVQGDELVIRAEMPGIDPEKDVALHVRDHVLELSAERREEQQHEEAGRYRSEFRYGRFSRRIPLPADASEDDVKATYQDGILEVRLPLDRKRSETTRIPIQRG